MEVSHGNNGQIIQFHIVLFYSHLCHHCIHICILYPKLIVLILMHFILSYITAISSLFYLVRPNLGYFLNYLIFVTVLYFYYFYLTALIYYFNPFLPMFHLYFLSTRGWVAATIKPTLIFIFSMCFLLF